MNASVNTCVDPEQCIIDHVSEFSGNVTTETENYLTQLLCWLHLAVSILHQSGVHPSICPVFFLTLISCVAHTIRYDTVD